MIAVFWAGFVLTGIAVMLAYVHLDGPRERRTVMDCWPVDVDDERTECGSCGCLWLPPRDCPKRGHA